MMEILSDQGQTQMITGIESLATKALGDQERMSDSIDVIITKSVQDIAGGQNFRYNPLKTMT